MTPDEYWNLVIAGMLAVGAVAANVWYIRKRKGK
jgi:hypothetical protein